MTFNSAFHILKHLNRKTIYFNMKYLPFKMAIKFPFFLSRNVLLKKVSGKLKIPEKYYPGIIKIGFGDVGIYDKKLSKSIWEVKGCIEFTGLTNIGHGTRISVGENGTLQFGANFNITAESSIVCFHKITFGDDCLLSWDVLMMDTDFHKIRKAEKQVNSDRSIVIGNHVWIGARCLILKGSSVPDGAVVAAGSVVNKTFTKQNCILAGVPAKIVNEDIEWTL